MINENRMIGGIRLNGFSFFKSKYIEFVIIDNSTVYFDEHCHSCDFIITIMIYGNAMLSLNSIDRTVHSNEFFKIAPYESHALSSESPITAVTMCIKKDLVFSDNKDSYKQQISDSLLEFAKHSNALDCSENLSDIFHRAALELFADYWCEDNNSVFAISRNEIETNPEQENDIEYYAQKSFVSKYHFIRKFKEIAGLTPHKFQIQSRIRKSQHLLLMGKSVADTAILTGFYDQSHFDKYFRKIVGISPTEYISSVRNFLQDKI